MACVARCFLLGGTHMCSCRTESQCYRVLFEFHPEAHCLNMELLTRKRFPPTGMAFTGFYETYYLLDFYFLCSMLLVLRPRVALVDSHLRHFSLRDRDIGEER